MNLTSFRIDCLFIIDLLSIGWLFDNYSITNYDVNLSISNLKYNRSSWNYSLYFLNCSRNCFKIIKNCHIIYIYLDRFKCLIYYIFDPLFFMCLYNKINEIYSWVNKGSLEVTWHCHCHPLAILTVYLRNRVHLFCGRFNRSSPFSNALPTHVHVVYDSLYTNTFVNDCTQWLGVPSFRKGW